MLIGDNVLRGRYGPTPRRHNGIKEEFIRCVLGGGKRNPQGRRPLAQPHNAQPHNHTTTQRTTTQQAAEKQKRFQ